MRVERYGYKWTRKANGYYQSTTAVDGKRRWLHQYTHAREIGPVPAGWHVHHKDRDKDNNDPGNLECLPPGTHFGEHAGERVASSSSPAQLAHLANIRDRALAAKRGEYVGARKLRALAVRWRVCPTCGETFRLHTKSRDDATYCSVTCQQRAHNKGTAADWGTPVACAHCGESFVPGPRSFGHQRFCSAGCYDKHRYAEKRIVRRCKACGDTMYLSAGNAPRYCERCRADGAGTYQHECFACGRPVVSRIKDGRVYCDRACANHARGLVRDPAHHERYKQAVREGRVDPRDRVPRDL